VAYQAGANGFHGLRWALGISLSERERRVARGLTVPAGDLNLDLDAVMAHLPLDDHPLFRELAPFWGG
jgi:hypothetical protein